MASTPAEDVDDGAAQPRDGDEGLAETPNGADGAETPDPKDESADVPPGRKETTEAQDRLEWANKVLENKKTYDDICEMLKIWQVDPTLTDQEVLIAAPAVKRARLVTEPAQLSTMMSLLLPLAAAVGTSAAALVVTIFSGPPAGGNDATGGLWDVTSWSAFILVSVAAILVTVALLAYFVQGRRREGRVPAGVEAIIEYRSQQGTLARHLPAKQAPTDAGTISL